MVADRVAMLAPNDAEGVNSRWEGDGTRCPLLSSIGCVRHSVISDYPTHLRVSELHRKSSVGLADRSRPRLSAIRGTKDLSVQHTKDTGVDVGEGQARLLSVLTRHNDRCVPGHAPVFCFC